MVMPGLYGVAGPGTSAPALVERYPKGYIFPMTTINLTEATFGGQRELKLDTAVLCPACPCAWSCITMSTIVSPEPTMNTGVVPPPGTRQSA